MTGKVWLVGAGPGDVGLMTLKGREALSQAEVVVYDALVGDGVLGLIPEGAKLIFAGKRSGKHFLRQEETNRVLFEEALNGKRVVRLKGGDPFVFGRGGEELELLVQHGIPFEIVPGVTSAFAVPAYNGIPVTHRDYCSSTHIITGHRRADHSYDIDFDALVRTGGTLVFLMGIAALPDLMNGLLAAGMDPDMPAAVLERGTTSKQRRVSATVGTLERACAETVVQTPAIIVVGRVCALAETFGWAEKRPLAGVRALVTRPRELVSTLSNMLRERGAEVVELPTIRIVPVNDMTRVDEVIEILSRGGYDWLVFTSPSGVGVFLDRLIARRDLRALTGVKLAAIGQGTQKALLKYGLRADFLPSVYDGETLGRELRAVCAPGCRILIPRAAIGNRELIEALEKDDDLTVTDVATYDTVYEPPRLIDVDGMFERSPEEPATTVNFAVFTSASTVRGFATSVPDVDFSRVNAVCIGRQTAAEAQKRGMRTWIAEKATLEALVKAVEEAARELKGNRNEV
jgi:uroporphyrinogen III methyltransferase/synthase